MATEMVTLPADALPILRRLLAVGLSAVAEIERVRDSAGYQNIPTELRTLHPTGCHEAGAFATALLYLEQAEPCEA